MRRGIPGALVSTAQQSVPAIPIRQLQPQTTNFPDDTMTSSIFSVEVPDDPITISIFSVEVPDGTSFARLASSSFWSSSAHFGNRDAFQTKPNRTKPN